MYDDIRAKLLELGVPENEIAFIHNAKSEVQKKDLFGKVRSGQVRILLGSTQRMGAGTNCQQKLVALHHLDCPWRPSDLQQREGRIIRQGNENPEVDIYSYVTECTFDAYLYQLGESKQKFISQIMTSKSPVRSAEDVDEQALSYAEIKALASGNPMIKEKMDLDIEVSKLKLLKANHLSQKYALEDAISKGFPKQIAETQARIAGYGADIAAVKENTHPNGDGFSPLTLAGVTHADKKEAGAALLTNLHLPNFLKGGLYQGAGKTVCVPGLNCYSCPAASGACPIGAFQAVVGSSKFSFSYYITGFLILLGVLLGRFICGFLCPFGWFQELLHKIPTKKLSTKRLKPLTYLKYAVLLVMVFLLPAFLVNDVGMGDPFFCKYLCPQGVLEGAIPLSLANSGIRAALGKLFTWKFSILLSVIALSVLFYRPFCKLLSPLGALYARCNRVSLFQMKVDKSKCVSCGKCAKACKMDVDVTKTPNHTECIRCGMCIRACPTNAVCFRYGFGDGKEKENAATLRENNNKA